jgi:Uma2 family endonuclease
MPVITEPRIMTSEELLAMPDDGVERWLVEGRLREIVTERPMTVRNRRHSRLMARLVHLLESWVDGQAEPHGMVLCGEAGCRLRRDPDTTVGIDVMYISAELVKEQPDTTSLIEGVPVLTVEILSPSDTHEDIHEKVDLYLRSGVALVWVVDPHDKTVLTYRGEAQPELVNIKQHLSGEPHLPGFHIAVAEIFT